VTVTAIRADTVDGRCRGSSAVYLDARAGANIMTDSYGYAGRDVAAGTYYVFDLYASFDTAVVPDDDVITDVVLSLNLEEDGSTTDFTMEARLFDWGASLTTADWVNGADLAALPLLATLPTAGIGATGAFKDFTSESAFIGAINSTGSTRMLICCAGKRSATPNADSEYLKFTPGNDGTEALRPLLTITHAPAPPAPAPPGTPYPATGFVPFQSARPRLLVGSAALGYTDLPLAVDKRWAHAQHGPQDASFRVPCRPFEALDPRLRRDSRLFISSGARCVWSGYLMPVSSAQSDGEFVTVEAAGTFERGKHDESFVRTFIDSDESRWWLRKGSSQRVTIENSGTLVLRAEGGGFEQPTNWKKNLKSELMYFLDDGLGDPADVITLLDFIWNCDMPIDWVSYVDAYTDPSAVTPISRIWTKNETGSGRVTSLACPANCRALAFGLRVATNNQLENDAFAELSDVYVMSSYGRVRVDEALVIIAADLAGGVRWGDSSPIGSDLEHLVWPLGSGSRSYAQESIASLHDSRTDWRYVPPAMAPGEDSFVAQELPTAPDNRQRWWFVSAKDPGVTVNLAYQDPEGMDIAAVLYTSKGGSRMLVPVPNPETVSVWPSGWDYSAGATVTNVAYGGWGFLPIGFLLTADDTDWDPRIGYVGASGYGAPVIAGAEYRATADVERCTTFWPNGDWPGPQLSVLWYDAAHAFISTTFVDWCAGVGGGESGQQIVSRGDRFTLGSYNGNNVTAPAGAAFGKLDVQFINAVAGGAGGQVAVSNCHLDSVVVEGTKLATAYHPTLPTSVDQRVRVFDYSSEVLTDAAADNVLHHAYAWYGVEANERDRDPVGTVGVVNPIKTIDGAPGDVAQVQTGDWITVVDDVDHVSWPQFIVGVEVTDDGDSASIQIGGDGGDFNYVGRADDPALQKRKRRRGHHRHVLWKVWAEKRRRNEYAKYLKESRSAKNREWKSYSSYAKAHPLAKKHPKWAPG
jgi:hypothetical protein